MPYADKADLRAYQLERYHRIRAEWFAGKSCVDCGSTEKLEPDHVDPDQKESHRVWSWRVERREAELAKCVVRCSSCHDKRHEKEWSTMAHKQTKHGWARYKKGCRCAVCVDVARTKSRLKGRRRRARLRAEREAAESAA